MSLPHIKIMGRPTRPANLPATTYWRQVGDAEELRRRKKEIQQDIANGWIYQKKKKRAADEVWTSFYLSNIPDDCTNGDLWRRFSSYGKMRDAFIPNKKDGHGNTFAFIRFAEVEDVSGLEGRLSNSYMGSLKVTANVMKFGRGEVTEGDKRFKEGSTVGKKEKEPEAVNPKTNNDKNVISIQPKVDKLFRVHFIDEVCQSSSFLNISNMALLGVTKDLETLENLRSLVDVDGFPEVEIIYVGGLTVLLTFPETAGMAKSMKEAMSMWNRWFESLKVWVGQPLGYSRLAWLAIRGIPLHLWDANLVDKIGNRFGKVIINPEITMSGKNLSVAKVCILTKEVSLLNERVEMKVGGCTFQ